MRNGSRTLLFGLILVAGLGVGLWLLAHGKDDWAVPDEAKKMKNPVAATPASLAAGKVLYMNDCAQCHGEQGKGDGTEAMMYDPPPADLTEAHMMNSMPDGEIFWKISEGRKPMPSFKKRFTEEQRWQLVNFVRSLLPKPATPPTVTKSPANKSAPPKKQ
jgi:mono/diheme cytochrome c family protein